MLNCIALEAARIRLIPSHPLRRKTALEKAAAYESIQVSFDRREFLRRCGVTLRTSFHRDTTTHDYT